MAYPPVNSFRDTRNNILYNFLSIGRFHSGKRSKRQDIIIDAFKIFCDKVGSNKYKLHLLGFVQDDNYMKMLLEKSKGYNIIFYKNINLAKKEQILSRCGIYIHACGYKINEDKNPELTEHYGISLVEAMASGCVPFVVPKGGPLEIVQNEKNGFHWESIDQLIDLLKKVTSDSELFRDSSKGAIQRSMNFSQESFQKYLERIISA